MSIPAIRTHSACIISQPYSNKGVILGRLIGQSLKASLIPPAFVRTIRAAGDLARVTLQREEEGLRREEEKEER